MTIRIDEVESINTNKNNITLTNGNIEYDYLVIATGADDDDMFFFCQGVCS